MKWRYWISLWCVLIVACLIVGFRTRASYTDRSSNWQVVLNAQYTYNGVALGGSSNVDYNTLASKSQLVVSCSFTGIRQAQNQCYLSNLKISGVYKGSKTLMGKTIQVYEPVDTASFPIDSFKALKNSKYSQMAKEYNELNQKFGIEGKTSYLESMNYTTNGFGHSTMFVTGHQYLLFLNLKSPQGLPTYIFLDSPYAKLTLNTGVNADTYSQPSDVISLKESFNYEILLKDSASIKTYFTAKKNILSQLNLI